MRSVRGAAVLVVVAVLAAVGFVVFAKDSKDSSSSPTAGEGGSSPTAPGQRKAVPIGDGSTSDTGPQPNQPVPEKLKPGEKPPQFVIFSWDGAGEQEGINLFSHFRQVAKENNATMSFFLSGIYLLPESKKALYHPPQHSVGASDIGYLKDENVKLTLQQLGPAWLEGNEIGTHFNGHFCGKKGGGDWSTAEWKSETEQAIQFVKNWKTNTGWTDMPSLPFDYSKELIGGRAPCLEGQKTLMPAEQALGFRYDASSPGGLQIWPRKKDGIWDFPLQSLPWPGDPSLSQLSMDYNIMYQLNKGDTKGDPSKFAAWEETAHQFYLSGFERAYTTNRAPLFVGNHFEQWNGGIYMKAVEDTVKSVCKKAEVRCVSFKQFADWLDAQDPQVVAQLQGLNVGEAPNWASLTGGGGGAGPAGYRQLPTTPAAVDPRTVCRCVRCDTASDVTPRRQVWIGVRAG